MTPVRVILVPFRVLTWNMSGTSFVLELVPLRGENEFEPHPQKRNSGTIDPVSDTKTEHFKSHIEYGLLCQKVFFVKLFELFSCLV